MPCNDQPLCGEGSTTCTSNHSNDILEAHHIAPSSSSTINGNIEQIVEERRVNISASAENPTSQHVQTVQQEQKTTINCSRSRITSFRSVNLQTIVLPGEELLPNPDSENCITMESCHLFLTQYRLIIISRNQNAMCAIPLTGVDLLEAKDIVGLQISCKDGRIIKFRAENSEMACTWYKKLMQKTCMARDLSNIFAFKFYAESMKAKQPPNWLRREMEKGSAHDQLKQEFSRFKLNDNWNISRVNENFDVCLTYPQHLIVPSSINNEELKQMSFGRCHQRFPTLVWRNRRNGAILLRSSQPSIGFFGMSMSNDKDVTLYEKIRAAISTDPNYKILIVDARSYTSAWANRAKGGGFETADTYTNAEVIFMGLPNIHNIRYSFHQLRQLLNASNDSTYLQMLQSTLWLHNIVQLFTATERCLNALCEGTSVLVHCSDGWDRTTQIVSLCMLIADPFYRTFDGFEMLIQRQWVEFGHKFGDRGGVLNSDENEKSPVFLQFLDCVFQLWSKNSHLFEFNRRYLMKLMQHTTSGLFGTFLFNSIKDALKMGYDPYDPDEQKQKSYQIWAYLGKHNAEFHNPTYNGGEKVMLKYPKSVPEVEVWRAAYCCTAEQSMINNPDDSMHQSNGTGSTQDITCDKASSTLSRSQSAASLTSLHELNQSNYSANNCSTFQLSNGTTTTTSGMGNCSIGSIYSTATTANCQGQPKLDVDGLSLLPLQWEDHMRRKYELEKAQQISKLTASTQNIAIRDANTMTNGKLPNGIIPTAEGGGMGISISRRTRNESVDSSTYEKVLPDVGVGDFRLKHNSSSSLTSVQPSSFSSCGEMMMPSSLNNGICCKNGTLQEGVETETMNGEDGLEMLHSQ